MKNQKSVSTIGTSNTDGMVELIKALFDLGIGFQVKYDGDKTELTMYAKDKQKPTKKK